MSRNKEWDWTIDEYKKHIKEDMRGTQIHYEATGDYDIIDVCNHYALNFNRGNVVKYIARAGKKQDELQDLCKAKDYIEREIAYIRELKNQKVKDFKEGN